MTVYVVEEREYEHVGRLNDRGDVVEDMKPFYRVLRRVYSDGTVRTSWEKRDISTSPVEPV